MRVYAMCDGDSCCLQSNACRNATMLCHGLLLMVVVKMTASLMKKRWPFEIR